MPTLNAYCNCSFISILAQDPNPLLCALLKILSWVENRLLVLLWNVKVSVGHMTKALENLEMLLVLPYLTF